MTETVKEWVLKQRLSNYGYDYPYFRRMTQHKIALKKKLAGMSDAEVRRTLAKANILGHGGRLHRTKGKVHYTTGQSFNEELLNIMEVSASGGKKSFWEVSENWLD